MFTVAVQKQNKSCVSSLSILIAINEHLLDMEHNDYFNIIYFYKNENLITEKGSLGIPIFCKEKIP